MATIAMVAGSIMAAMVQQGASRQALAAVAAALIRSVSQPSCDDAEVADRLEAIRPTIEAGLSGGKVASSTKARRNVAKHNFSVHVADYNDREIKVIQRAGKARCHAEAIVQLQESPHQASEARKQTVVECFYVASDADDDDGGSSIAQSAKQEEEDQFDEEKGEYDSDDT